MIITIINVKHSITIIKLILMAFIINNVEKLLK